MKKGKEREEEKNKANDIRGNMQRKKRNKHDE